MVPRIAGQCSDRRSQRERRHRLCRRAALAEAGCAVEVGYNSRLADEGEATVFAAVTLMTATTGSILLAEGGSLL